MVWIVNMQILVVIIKDNFDSFKIKYELEGNALSNDLIKKIVGEIENRFNNKINIIYVVVKRI